VQHVFQFSAPLIGQALGSLFSGEADSFRNAIAGIGSGLGDIFEQILNPQFDYGSMAQTSQKVAAALAPIFFLLRLAAYHYNRLTGEQDSIAGLVGDWVLAAALAAATPVIVQWIGNASFWITRTIVGDISQNAAAMVASGDMLGFLGGSFTSLLFGGLLSLVSLLGMLLAVLGILMAFAIAQGMLYLLVIIGPPLAIISVVPQMRWVRGLELKVLGILFILPIIAGGVIQATASVTLFTQRASQGVSTAGQISLGGLAPLLKTVWLLTADGLLMSMAGALGKFGLSTSVDAGKQLVGAVATTAAMVATGGAAAAGLPLAAAGGAAAGGQAAGGAAAGAGASSATAAQESAGMYTAASAGETGAANLAETGGAAGSGTAAPADVSSIQGHLQKAADYTRRAGMANAMGFHGAGSVLASRAQLESQAAHSDQLQMDVTRWANAQQQREAGEDKSDERWLISQQQREASERRSEPRQLEQEFKDIAIGLGYDWPNWAHNNAGQAELAMYHYRMDPDVRAARDPVAAAMQRVNPDALDSIPRLAQPMAQDAQPDARRQGAASPPEEKT
jgi:hypothetical protein